MKIRKLALLTALLMSAATVNAEPIVSVTDSMTNKINVSGKANGTNATLMILNPGYTKKDADSGVKNAVQFLRSTTAGDKYSFDVNIIIPENYQGEKFTAVVNTAGVLEETSFSLYSADEKLDAIDDLNGSASSMADRKSVV